MDAAFKETTAKIGRILDITERVNEKLVRQTRNVATKQGIVEMNEKMEKKMNEMNEKIEMMEEKMDANIDAKMNELNEKMDAILAAIQACTHMRAPAGSTLARTLPPLPLPTDGAAPSQKRYKGQPPSE